MSFVFLVLGLLFFGLLAFISARLANVCYPVYRERAVNNAPPRLTRIDLDRALSLCDSSQRGEVLELYETINGNYDSYIAFKQKRDKDQNLVFSLFIPPAVALICSIINRVYVILIPYMVLYIVFLLVLRKRSPSSSPFDDQFIPEVTLSGRTYNSADELIRSWNNALDCTGYPLVYNMNSYDKLFKEARSSFPFLLIVSFMFFLSMLID